MAKTIAIALLALFAVGMVDARALPRDFSDLAKEIKAVMNFSVDPCEDFYEYACGTWRHTFPLPGASSRYSLATNAVDEKNKEILRSILEDPSGEWPIIGPFYSTCKNMDQRNQRGIEDVQAILGAIKVSSAHDLFAAVGKIHALGGSSLFSSSVSADPMNPGVNILHVAQGGLTLDTPADYGNDAIVSKFVEYATAMFSLSGSTADEAAAAAKDVLAVEKQLAAFSLDPASLRDPYATYHKTTHDAFVASTPAIDASLWDAYFAAAGIKFDSPSAEINVVTPAFFGNLSAATSLEPSVLSNYLRFQTLSLLAPSLSDAFVNANFDFFGKTLTGQKDIEPLQKRCIAATDKNLGFLLGRYYVAQAFSPAAKDLALDMIKRIEDAFADNLKSVDWMDDTTRQLAKEKLGMVTKKVGYPDKWVDYSSVEVVADSYVSNVIATQTFAAAQNFAQLGKPVDAGQWDMTPPTVNAYYDPTKNVIAFPAGILQSPWFFNLTYPAAINFGGIGAAMGHELTHGFDDQGAQYDGTGKLRKWWPDNIFDRFAERTRCVSDLYSTFSPLPGVFVNGNLTLGENVADIGGLHLAFNAYRGFTHDHGEDPVIVDGLTNDQVFFVSYAFSWCEVETDAAVTRQTKVDPHSPSRFRVNGPLSQSPFFSDTFKCAPNTKMNPTSKCVVW